MEGIKKESQDIAEIIDNDYILREDVYTQEVLRTRVAANGQPVTDIEKFLENRRRVLELWVAQAEVDLAKSSDPNGFALANEAGQTVGHSVKPELDK